MVLLILNAMSDAEVSYPTADSVCSCEGCERPAWRSCTEGKCLYHSPSNGDSDEAARLVWNTARRMAADKDVEECDFRGWHFPADPDGHFEGLDPVGWFVGCTFERSVSFERATFSGGAWFVGATFSGDAGFGGATFSGYAGFWGATFSGIAWFDRATFSVDASFRRATFSRDARFAGAMFCRAAWFVGATFSGDAGFRRAAFSGVAWFEGATFSADAWFNGATFSANARFGGATFVADTSFSGARFRPGVNIIFEKPRRGRPFRLRREGETAYRLAKQAAQERGDYAEAGDYHYAEQCAIEDKYRKTFGCDFIGNRPRRKAFWGWCISIGRFLFGRLVYGYGERPMRPLFIALVVIILWTGFYWLGGAIVPSDPGLDPAARAAYEPSVGECLYCSIVTFTTLGYGDYQPKEPYRLLAASEALLGAALMAVFIVCLSKKYVR